MSVKTKLFCRALLLFCASLSLLLSPSSNRAQETLITASIEHTKVDAELIDIPVMLKLNESGALDFFDRVVSNPAYSKKFRVEDDQGNPWYVEKELWDYSNQLVILHVKVPLVSSTADTVIKLYDDEAMADSVNYLGDPGTQTAQNVRDANFTHVLNLTKNGDATEIRIKGIRYRCVAKDFGGFRIG